MKSSLILNDDGQLELPSNEKKRVSLLPYKKREPINFELMSDEELYNGAGGTMMLDSEIFYNYTLFAFKDHKTKKYVLFEIPFNERKLSWIMHNYTVVTFNGIKFDIPILWLAYKIQNRAMLRKLAWNLIQGMWWQEACKEFDFTVHKTPHIDLIEVCPLRGSLKLYGARLHAKRIQDLPWSAEDNLEPWQIPITENYCINDLDNTELLYDNLNEQLKLRYDLSSEYKQDLMSKSDAQIAEAVIGSEIQRITGKWPSKPKIETSNIHKFVPPANMFFQTDYMKNILKIIAKADFALTEAGRLIAPPEIANLKIQIANSVYRMGIGGLHSSEENTSVLADDEYELSDVDVASFYPKIVLNCNLYPEHLGEDFSIVYNGIVDRRLAAKKTKNLAISECLKITINGTFGKTGSPFSFLYAPEMTIQITVGGQLYLLMLIEQLELNGISIYSANTDGIVIHWRKNQKEKMLQIIKMWEKITGFETEETKYKAVYSRDVNAYMAIKPDGEIKGKNVYYDPWRGKTAKDGYWRFQKNPNCQICVEAIENLILKQIPIEKTITECRDLNKFVAVKNVKGGAHKNREYLGHVIRWAYFKDEVGTINYIMNDHKVPDTEGARPLMDMPETFPDDLDYDRYIIKANEMLEDMDYIKKKKQLVFF